MTVSDCFVKLISAESFIKTDPNGVTVDAWGSHAGRDAPLGKVGQTVVLSTA